MSPAPRFAPRPVPLLLLVGTLYLAAPRLSRGETTLAYKYEDYRELGGRIGVQAQYGSVEQSLGLDAKLKLSGVIDVITGATPTGQPAANPGDEVPLTQLEERRKAWNLDYSQQFGRFNLAVGAANSRESDYVSNGLSINTLTDFNEKNTSLVLGVSGTDDRVKVFYQTDRATKRGVDVILGVNQLLDAYTTLSVDFTFGRTTGYLSDPYKLVEKQTEVLPGVFLPLTFGENRPAERNKWILFFGYNHAFDRLHAALDASYRYYHDTYGTTSHTFEATWLQRLGAKFILEPGVRFYEQGAADFYAVNLDGSSIVPDSTPNPAGPFYSADYRLSKMQTLTYGVKVVWNATDQLQFDVALNRYEMRGQDSVTPSSAYPTANILSAGVRFAW